MSPGEGREKRPDILIVDDSAANLHLLSRILGDAGYRARPASSGETALRSIAAKTPDLLLLDLRMEGMDGIEVCRRIKADAGTSGIPVLFISAAWDADDKVRAFEAGAADFMTKPFDPGEVLARVATHLALRRSTLRLEESVRERTASLLVANEALERELEERRRSEARLRESQDRFRVVFERSPLGKALMSPDGRFVEVNQALADILGRTIPEILSTDLESLTHPGDREETRRLYEALLSGAVESERIEKRYLGGGGDTLWMDENVALLRDEAGEPRFFVTSLADVTQRKRAEEDLRRSLTEKETLLRELYHRTKNNMGVINALIGLEADYIGDARLTEAFEQTQHRIRSMALVHQKLYEGQDLSRINLKEYIESLVPMMMTSYGITAGRIEMVPELEDLPVIIDTAIPCGLILNELISNALKHAFPLGRRGRISVGLKRLETGEIELGFADDGPGLPGGFNPRRDGHMGLQTIFGLAENQLRAQVQIETEDGVSWRFLFRDNLYHPRV